jgi:hypothetical protein
MNAARFQELIVKGFSLSNKISFREWNQDEFETWIDDCRDLLSRCEPEPEGFPWCPDQSHIEEIVMLLSQTRSRISRGDISYVGLF